MYIIEKKKTFRGCLNFFQSWLAAWCQNNGTKPNFSEPNRMPNHAESNRSQCSALWFSLGHSALSVSGAAQWVSSCHALYIIIRSMHSSYPQHQLQHHPPSSTSTTSSSSSVICEFADCDYERSYRTAKRSLLIITCQKTQSASYTGRKDKATSWNINKVV